MPVPEPWSEFLHAVDGALDDTVELHCLGGFVLTALWGLPRPTGDIDVVRVIDRHSTERLLDVAGEGSALSTRYQLRVDRVMGAEYPEEYASRLIEIAPGSFQRLRLRGFEAHDLALSKLRRASMRDREDIRFLAGKGALDPETLKRRFDLELKPNMLNPRDAEATLDVWIEVLFG